MTELGASEDGRVFLRDVKPYYVVDSLDQLQTPAGGVVTLSHSGAGPARRSPRSGRSPGSPTWPRSFSSVATRSSRRVGRDAGFDVGMFAQQLAAVLRLQEVDVEDYGVSAEQLEAIKGRCTQWAADLRAIGVANEDDDR